MTAYISSPSRSASSNLFKTKIPNPSPINIPSALSSNGRICPDLEKAGVLLKDIYIKGELSVSTPPVSIMSHRPSTNSLNAILIALKEAAHAASTTLLIPPKSNLLVIRPAITFPNKPGKEFSFQPINAFFIFSIIGGISASAIPLACKAFFQIGYCKRPINGPTSFCPPPTPNITPVFSFNSLVNFAEFFPYPACANASLAATKPSNCEASVTSKILGGKPNSIGLKSMSGMKPPTLQ